MTAETAMTANRMLGRQLVASTVKVGASSIVKPKNTSAIVVGTKYWGGGIRVITTPTSR